MNEGLIAKRYAKALIEYAASHQKDGELYDCMKRLHDSLNSVPRMRYILASPVISKEDKKALICAAAGEADSGVFGAFVNLITDNGRETILRGITICYMDIYREINNISVVRIASAEPMSEEFERRVRADVTERTHGQVEMDIRIAPELEGGFVFQIDDLRLDASIKGQLESIRRQFIKRNRAIV